jgi:hypothetical protein
MVRAIGPLARSPSIPEARSRAHGDRFRLFRAASTIASSAAKCCAIFTQMGTPAGVRQRRARYASDRRGCFQIGANTCALNGSYLLASHGCPREHQRSAAPLRVHGAGRHRHKGARGRVYLGRLHGFLFASMRMLPSTGPAGRHLLHNLPRRIGRDVTSWWRFGAILTGLALSAKADHC